MSLNVDFKKESRIGYFTERFESVEGVKTYRVDICAANCACAMIRFDEERRGNLVAFFVDLPHAKRCIEMGMLKDWSNFNFNAKNMTSEMWQVVRLLAENGKKVTIK